MEPKSIKIHAVLKNGTCSMEEQLVADFISDRKARLTTIPMCLEYGLGDVVSFDPNNKNTIVSVIRKGSWSCGGEWEQLPKLNSAMRQEALLSYLGRLAIQVRFICPISFVLSIPLNMSLNRLKRIIDDCPIEFHRLYPSSIKKLPEKNENGNEISED